jgi:HK97 family phage major capsid protein/HK97 family phage prohead protease
MQTLHRTLEIDNVRDLQTDSRTIDISFSSNLPYERSWGIEVLDHGHGSVRMDRLKNSAPLLLNHDINDQIGVVESARIDHASNKGRAVVRFGSSARAQEIYQDVKDGIRKLVSVGYRVHDMQQDTKNKELFIVNDWEPFEISIVPVPADTSVGVGRSDETFDISQFKKHEVNPMPETRDIAHPVVDVKQITSQARESEQGRVSAIIDIATRHNARDMADDFIRSGKSLEDFKTAVLEKALISEGSKIADAPDIGMSDNDVKRFSFVRAVNALANPTDRRAQEAAAFEFECSREAASKTGHETRGIFIPSDILKRDLNVTTTTAGGYTVSTDLLGQSFIDLLRNSTEVMQRSRLLTDLNGNIAIPRQTGGATAYWVAESGAPTESQQTFDQVTLAPKTVGAFVDFSRKLMIQSSIDVEAFIRGDLARVLGLEIDRVAVNGSGASNQPTGILNVAGIGSVAGGTNGLAPAFSHIVDLETAVATANADVGSLFYISNAKVRGKLKQTPKAANTAAMVFDGNSMNGYTALTTNQVPSNLTKGTSSGVCSAIIFGNLADLIIGMWGGLDLMVDPYTGSTTGTVRVVALQDVDVAVRHAESFAAMKDALTV